MTKEIGTFINNRYRIDSVLGEGGCGTTYYALDSVSNSYIALKELSINPEEIDNNIVSSLLNMEKIPGIVSLYDFFAFENTYYVAMEYIQGMNAVSYFDTYRSSLNEQQILGIMQPVINGVAYLNSIGIIHGDISTNNIMVDMNGYGVLIDLPIGSFSSRIKQGFSPIELYYNPPMPNATTDVYGLSATLYNMFTGAVPTDAYQVSLGNSITDVKSLSSNISDNTASVITQGLSYEANARHSDVKSFGNELYKQSSANTQPVPSAQATGKPYIASSSMKTYDPKSDKLQDGSKKASTDTKSNKNSAKKKRIFIAFGIVAALLVILGVSITVYVISNKKQDDENEQAQSEQAEQQAMEEEEYAEKMDKYADAVEEINNPTSWDAVDEAVKTLMELGDFEDSKSILFDTAYSFLVDYDDYDRALNIYEYLDEDTDDDGVSGKEWCDECNFQKALRLYYDDDYTAAKDILEDLDPYTSILNSSDKSTDILDECNYQIALSDVYNENSSGYATAEDIFWERSDYDALSNLASNYYNAGDYDKAEEIYMELTEKSGYSYEDEIHNCQAASNLANKYASYNATESTIYDTNSGTVNSYVDQNTAEDYMDYMYDSFKNQNGESIDITQIEINGQKYGIKKIAIDTRNSTNIQVTFFYLNSPDTEHTMTYQADVEYTVTNEDGSTYTSSHNEVIIDGVSYAGYWD